MATLAWTRYLRLGDIHANKSLRVECFINRVVKVECLIGYVRLKTVSQQLTSTWDFRVVVWVREVLAEQMAWHDNLPSSPTCVRMNDIYPSLFAGFVNGWGSTDFHVSTTSTVGRKFAQTNSQIHYGTCESNNSKLCVICVKWETSPSNQRWRLVKYWIVAPGSIFHYFYHFRFRVNKMDEWLKFTTSIPLFSIVRHIRQSCG